MASIHCTTTTTTRRRVCARSCSWLRRASPRRVGTTTKMVITIRRSHIRAHKQCAITPLILLLSLPQPPFRILLLCLGACLQQSATAVAHAAGTIGQSCNPCRRINPNSRESVGTADVSSALGSISGGSTAAQGSAAALNNNASVARWYARTRLLRTRATWKNSSHNATVW